MKIDDFLKQEMNWTDRDLEYKPTIGYWKVVELLKKWGEKQLLLHNVSNSLDLVELEKKLDEALNSETSETLKEWLHNKRL